MGEHVVVLKSVTWMGANRTTKVLGRLEERIFRVFRKFRS